VDAAAPVDEVEGSVRKAVRERLGR
jgi:hypothetical protein